MFHGEHDPFETLVPGSGKVSLPQQPLAPKVPRPPAPRPADSQRKLPSARGETAQASGATLPASGAVRAEVATPKSPPAPAHHLATKAADVCRHLSLEEPARQLLREDFTVLQYLSALIENERYPDATGFLAHALPKREAVWWACRCAREGHGPEPSAPTAAALQASEKWAAEPNEDNRRATLAAAEAAGLKTPAAFVGLAAFWSGGSLAPAHVPSVPPEELLTARTVATAVLVASVLTEPEKATEKLHRFLGQGIAIANGTQLWPSAARKE
jgi:hypothetical protein